MPDKYLSPHGRSCEPVRWVARSQRSRGRLFIRVSTGRRAGSVALDGMGVRAGASPHVIVGCRAGVGPGW